MPFPPLRTAGTMLGRDAWVEQAAFPKLSMRNVLFNEIFLGLHFDEMKHHFKMNRRCF